VSEQFFQNRHNVEGHGEAHHVLFARALAELYWPHPCKTFYPLGEKHQLHSHAFRLIGDVPITYLEFGVYGGWSFERILRQFRNRESRFYGFDSFEGLPEEWGEMKVGHFSTDGETPQPDDKRAKFIKGWFQNTVPGFLKEEKIGGVPLIHFDADLYSSTLFLMTTLWHYIPDYWFIFDEFQPDEIVAMRDFTRAYPVEFQFIACTAGDNKIPQQLLGRLRTVPFAP